MKNLCIWKLKQVWFVASLIVTRANCLTRPDLKALVRVCYMSRCCKSQKSICSQGSNTRHKGWSSHSLCATWHIEIASSSPLGTFILLRLRHMSMHEVVVVLSWPLFDYFHFDLILTLLWLELGHISKILENLDLLTYEKTSSKMHMPSNISSYVDFLHVILVEITWTC